MKKNIAIVAGGFSSESVVSLKSADGLYSFIDKDKYNVYIVIIKKDEWAVKLPDGDLVPINKNNFGFSEFGMPKLFDFAYITIHGTPGEDGRLQGYFDLIDIPYSSCNTLVSALTFNKFVCNSFLRSQGIRVADSLRLFKGQEKTDEEIIDRLGLPLFVKPNDSGSSFGVTKVKEAEGLQEAISKAFSEGDEVILESFIEGREVTCGCYKVKGKETIFPITEVVTPNEFFDFDAKYNGQVQEITPARISPELTSRIQKETSRIYDVVGASGLVRVDYIILSDGEPVLLEINTTPGMTKTSFIPQQIEAAGLDIKNVLTEIIENTLNS